MLLAGQAVAMPCAEGAALCGTAAGLAEADHV